MYPEFAQDLIKRLQSEITLCEQNIYNSKQKIKDLETSVVLACKAGKLHNGASFHTGPGDYCTVCGKEF